MATLNVGKIAMKIAGREAGKYCVVLTNPKDNFVTVTGPKVLTGVKRRRCNIDHLEPTQYQVKLEAEASDKKVIDALKKEGLLKKLGLKEPSPEVVKGPEMKGKKGKKPQKSKKEASRKEEKKEGRTITISLPKLGRKKEEPKPEKKPVKKKTEKKEAKTKKKTTSTTNGARFQNNPLKLRRRHDNEPLS